MAHVLREIKTSVGVNVNLLPIRPDIPVLQMTLTTLPHFLSFLIFQITPRSLAKRVIT